MNIVRAPFHAFMTAVVFTVTLGACILTASAQEAGAIKEAGKLEAPELRQVGGTVLRHLAFAPDGKELFASGTAMVVFSFDNDKATSAQRGNAAHVAYTKDGKKRLAYVHDQGLTVWDVKTGKQLSSAHPQALGFKIGTPGISPVGPAVLGFAPDGKIALGTTTFELTKPINKPGFSYQLRLYDVARGKEIRAFPFKHASDIVCLAMSADGKRAVSGSNDRTARVWDISTGKELAVFKEHASPVRAVAFTPDGQRIVSAGGAYPEGPKDGKFGEYVIHVWDAKTGKALARFDEHRSNIFGLAVTPDGKRVVSSDSAGTGPSLHVWDIDTGKGVASVRPPTTVYAVAISPDGRRVATVSDPERGIVRMWQLP